MTASPLGGLRANVRRLQSPEFMRQMGAQAGLIIQRQIKAGFDEQRDPYGVPWAPRKRGGSWPILNKTGKLKDSITVRPRLGGGGVQHVDVEVGARYGRYHITGTDRMVARPFVPTSQQLPPAWEAGLRQAADRQFARVWGR